MLRGCTVVGVCARAAVPTKQDSFHYLATVGRSLHHRSCKQYSRPIPPAPHHAIPIQYRTVVGEGRADRCQIVAERTVARFAALQNCVDEKGLGRTIAYTLTTPSCEASARGLGLGVGACWLGWCPHPPLSPRPRPLLSPPCSQRHPPHMTLLPHPPHHAKPRWPKLLTE